MALPYTFEFRSVQPGGKPRFAIIKTELSRVKPEIINTQMLVTWTFLSSLLFQIEHEEDQKEWKNTTH